MNVTDNNGKTPEEIAEELRSLVNRLQRMDRHDLLLRAISVPMLERLLIEAERAKLSRLTITKDFRFLLSDYDTEVLISPIHKALYILFLNHPDGIEFKDLPDHKAELMAIYGAMLPSADPEKTADTVNRLTDPTDNSINEKCARIKTAFAELMDKYRLTYYMISSHTTRYFDSSSRVWFKRLKMITLPRHLVTVEPPGLYRACVGGENASGDTQ